METLRVDSADEHDTVILDCITFGMQMLIYAFGCASHTRSPWSTALAVFGEGYSPGGLRR